MSLEPILFVPDTHVPFEDKRAFSLMLKVAKDLKPKHLVIIGDFADCLAVSNHSKDPIRATQLPTEVAAVNARLTQLDALGATNKVYIEGNHCLSADHRILTRRGWKTYDQVTVGEEVATRNSDGYVEWQPVNEIIVRALGTDNIYDYQSRGVSIRVTDGHRIYGQSNGGGWIKNAKDCPDSFDISVSAVSGAPEYAISDAMLRVAAWASTDVHYATRYAGIVLYQSEGKHELLRNDLLAAEISFEETARHRNITHICGIKLKQPTKRHFEFRLPAVVGRLIRNLTGLESKGRLPSWVNLLSDRQWELFLERLIQADGTVISSTCYAFYGKKALCEDVQIAAILHGWRATLSEYRPGQFRVNLTKTTTLRVDGWKASVDECRDPDELVWCVRVTNGNFFTERNGKPHLTGNCDRLKRYLRDKAPELFGIVSAKQLFKLDERGWKFIPYRKHTKLGKLYLTHDVGSSGRNSTFKALDTYQHSIVIGHSHRLQMVVEGNAIGEVKVAAQFGWLGDKNEIDYMQQAKVNTDTAHGFGIGYLDPKTGYVYLQPIPIVNYSCVVEGKLYK